MLTAQEAIILLRNLGRRDLTDLEREALGMAVIALTDSMDVQEARS